MPYKNLKIRLISIIAILFNVSIYNIAKGIGMLEKEDLPGFSFSLSTGTIYIPPYFHPQGKKENIVNLVIHFHGAPWIVEQNFYFAQKNAVQVTISLPGLSGVYTNKYKDRQEFGRLLNEIMKILEREKIVNKPRLGKLCLTSFSAGFGALREILKVPKYYRLITDIVCADSIHCGFVSVTSATGVITTLNKKQMAPFLKFAKDAVQGKKTMLITHSEIDPLTYASTTKTADYLIEKVGAIRKPVSLLHPSQNNNMKLLSAADKGNFHVRGYAGNTPQDHMDHLYKIADFIKETSLPGILATK